MSHFDQLRNLSALTLLAVTFCGCAAYGGEVDHPHSYPHPSGSIHIPKGHLPPPGECRIWFLDLPPGQQPPPGDCYELERHVPPDAILVRG